MPKIWSHPADLRQMNEGVVPLIHFFPFRFPFLIIAFLLFAFFLVCSNGRDQCRSSYMSVALYTVIEYTPLSSVRVDCLR